MNTQNIFGLATLGLTAALVVACSGTSQDPVPSESDVNEPAGSGAKLPAGTATKTPASAGGDKSATPSGGTPSGGTPSGGTPSGGKPGTPAQPGTPADPGAQPGPDGQQGRISVNEHCCYGATYYKCPNAAACFGGFDLSACLAVCAGPQDPCFDACFEKSDKAGAPKGCQTGVTPPKGIDCANGQINI